MPENNRAKRRRKTRNNKNKNKKRNDSGNICDANKKSPSPQLSEYDTNDDDLERIVSEATSSDMNSQKSEDAIKLQEEVFSLRDEVKALCTVKEYKVESPPQTLKHKNKPKFQKIPKSKSLDDDEVEQFNIVEITEDIKSDEDRALAIIESNAIVSEAESDIDWEVTSDLLEAEDSAERVSARGTLCIETLTLDLADCQNTQTLSPDEELSLRQYLQTLNLVTCPQDLSTNVCKPDDIDQYNTTVKTEEKNTSSKKSEEKNKSTEKTKKNIKEYVLPVPATSRFLEVIDEEGSNESSETSRRHSYLPAHQTHECSDLEDDVFYDKNTEIMKCVDRFPRHLATRNRLTEQDRIQKCVLVGTKVLDETPKEGCSTWKLETVDEKMNSAEVVYLEDSSSSASEVCDDASDEGGDGDEEVRIHTPIIELDSNKEFASQCLNSLDILPSTNIAEKTTAKVQSQFDMKTPPPTPNNTLLECDAVENHSIDNFNPNVFGNNKEITENASQSIEVTTSEDSCTSNEELKVKINLDKQHEDSQVSEIDALKEELNSALMNLVQTLSDDKLDSSTSFSRQDSLSSVCSQSTTHSTAKYNPTTSSLTDITSILHDEIINANSKTESSNNDHEHGHVKEVIQCVSGIGFGKNTCTTNTTLQKPEKLKDICLKTISALSCGSEILQELANVAEELENINLLKSNDIKESILKLNESDKISSKMPYYPLPDLSTINKVVLSKNQTAQRNQKESAAPPSVKPRNSSLNVSVNDPAWTAVTTNKDPSMFMCISPSQKHLIDITKTKIKEKEASQLIDLHQKYVERRGCREYFSDGYDSETTTITRKHQTAGYNDNKFFEVNRPFISPSGNRLLAIIRESSVTPHEEFRHTLKETSRSCDHLNKKRYYNKPINNNLSSRRSESWDYRINHQNHYSTRDVPVPPPRSRAYSATIYESDESSDYTDYSHNSNSEGKRFYHSMGQLNVNSNKEDTSHLRSMYKINFNDQHVRRPDDVDNALSDDVEKSHRRRLSLPQSMNEKQLQYILKKERLVEEQIERLETEKKSYHEVKEKKCPRAPLMSEEEYLKENKFDSSYFQISRQRDIAVHCDTNANVLNKNPIRAPTVEPSEEEKMREKMYSEYMDQVAERAERKQHKVIKITSCPLTSEDRCISKSLPQLHNEIRQACNAIEDEFITKAKERWQKLGIHDPETEDERENKDSYKPIIVEKKIKVIEEGQEKDVKRLPNHLREFVQFTASNEPVTASPETVMITPTFRARASSPVVWCPGERAPPPPSAPQSFPPPAPPPPPASVWTPRSAGPSPPASRHNFRPVAFNSPPLLRRYPSAPSDTPKIILNGDPPRPALSIASGLRLPSSSSAPGGIDTLGGYAPGSGTVYRNPATAQAPAPPPPPAPGAVYLPRSTNPEPDRLHNWKAPTVKKEAEVRSSGGTNVMSEDGVGPTTKDGMPVSLRSEVKDPSKWYKKMYDTIHKNKYDDDYVTVRYKNPRGTGTSECGTLSRPSSNRSQYAYFDTRSGYLSEPEHGRANTAPRRRPTANVAANDSHTNQDPIANYTTTNKFSTLASARAQQEVYRSQPGKIENYVPGRSSVIDKEAKQWWDEVMDIFDGWMDDNSPLPQYSTVLARAIQKSQLSNSKSLHMQPPPAASREKKNITSQILSKCNMARALKESGYESDSTLVFRRREDVLQHEQQELSPRERRSVYRDVQAGGEPPLRGFRTPAPERPRDDSDIEYFPLSPTLTRIRVHRNLKGKDVPAESGKVFGKYKRTAPSFVNFESSKSEDGTSLPPAPPRRVSSKDNSTLKLVSSGGSTSKYISDKNDGILNISNVNFLKNKISEKLSRKERNETSRIDRQGRMKSSNDPTVRTRVNSSSAPPSVNRIKATSSTSKGTSSFRSPRRTISPTQYSHSTHSRYNKFASDIRVPIQGGAGRRTPITAILNKTTCLDKTVNIEKRTPVEIRKRASKSSESTTSKEIKKANLVSVPKSNLSTSTSNKFASSLSTSDTSIYKTTGDKPHKLSVSTSSRSQSVKFRLGSGVKTSADSLSSSTSTINLDKRCDSLTSKDKTKNKRITKSDHTTPTDMKKIPIVITVKKNRGKADENNNCKIKNGSMDSTFKVKKQSKKAKNKIVGDRMDHLYGDKLSDISLQNERNASEFGYELPDNKESMLKTNAKEIYAQRDAIDTNSFFQHLFLRDVSPASSTNTIMSCYSTSVLEKAKLFQSGPQQYLMNRSINSYLVHKKPVSQSKFRILDKLPWPEERKSQRSISWPGRMTDNTIRKIESIAPRTRQDSDEEFGSSCSISTIRSRSVESPNSKLYFSQTSRPKSHDVLFHKKELSPLRTIHNCKRSISPSKNRFSQTCSPISPVIQVEKGDKKRANSPRASPTKIVFSQTSRPVSPVVLHRNKHRLSRSLSPTKILTATRKSVDQVPKIILTQTSRPTSPTPYRRIKYCSEDNLSRSHSPSPASVRSPSHRKIHSARIIGNLKNAPRTMNYPKKIVIRTRSAGEADSYPIRNANCIIRSSSSLNINNGKDLDYNEYISDIQDDKPKSERFRELNRYYSLLERVGELEKATSSGDLRHRRKDEEIIDFERWKKIRAIERAEEELDRLYYKLRSAQEENDVLFYPRDIKDFRWNYNKDRGLRIKEKSVEDLKEHFQNYDDTSHLHSSNYYHCPTTDIYKPFWRGTSVANLATNLNNNEKYSGEDSIQVTLDRPKNINNKSSLSDLRKRLGLGSRLWSSLSMEQVNVLKNQLNAIYSKDPEPKVKPRDHEPDDYVITVPENVSVESHPQLHVRCNSFTSSGLTEQNRKQDLQRSDSISSMNVSPSVKEIKNEYNAKCQLALSETEKRKISQTLSQEVLDRVKRVNSDYRPVMLAKETRGATAAARAHASTPPAATSVSPAADNHFRLPDENMENDVTNETELCNINHQQITTYALCPSSASETETGSSDISNKTVIFRGPSELIKKVEYFEKVKYENEKGTTIHRARDDSLEEDISENLQSYDSKNVSISCGKISPQNKYSSQSCANLKELFGETENQSYYSSLPLKSTSHISRSPSPRFDSLHSNSLKSVTNTRYSSADSLCRSRSLSPDPERYWRAYLSLVKAGDVRRLKRRFESVSPSSGFSLRKYRSDPEIARSMLRRNWDKIKAVTVKRHECGEVDKLTHKYELFGRERNRLWAGGLVSSVAKVPSRRDDRLMPHIDVISKLASLTRRTAASPASRCTTDYPPECPVGEVYRIRKQFESMSPLGQIFTSTPDVRELRDIAPYLAGSWTAHKFPKRRDNNRSYDGLTYVSEDLYAPVRKDRRRPKSTSPERAKGVKLSSILKTDPHEHRTALSEQPFDPTLHRPVSRYQPSPPAPPAPPPIYLTRPTATVTFKEPDWAPEPPKKGLPIRRSGDTESPRRYVESDVNIHYRVPVRQEPRPNLPEHELAERQADHMRRLYQEERRRKYLQDYGTDMTDAFDLCTKELQDMQSRRHTDNFTPSQKSAVPLDRYDSLEVAGGVSAGSRGGPQVRARALYAFTNQSPRELAFRKNDIITVRRQIDANWYEGELAGKVGLFPYNYVELIKNEEVGERNGSSDVTTLRKLTPAEGKARARFDFVAQTNLELPLRRGELVALVRRVDDNWWEGRRGDRTGIFPHTYVQVLATPITPTTEVRTPSEKSLPLTNGSTHRSTTAASTSQTLPKYRAAPATATIPSTAPGISATPRTPSTSSIDLNNREPLYVDTNAEAVPYRAMYKYRPQNPDELELVEGDTVYVLEQCDDGWYVGSSQRTGRLGTFPGNYVRRI